MHNPKAIQAMIEFYSRHLVALCVAIRSETDEHFRANCGFLLEVREKIFLVTAGHILEQWIEGFKNPNVEVTGSWLWGSFKSRPVAASQIPFEFARYNKTLLFDKRRGLDFGVIELPDECISQLLARNVVVINGERLPSVDEQFDSYVMVGLPTAATEWDMRTAKVSPTVLGSSRAQLPPDRRNIEFREFAGQLGRNLSLDGPNSIDGMSGGYVLGLRKQNGETRYWPFAIQSWCRPDEGLAFACPINNLADLLATKIDQERS